jgi:integrase
MVSPLSARKNPYGGLTTSEVKRILAPESIDLSSERDRVYYNAVKVAFFSGLRIGEICGLYTDDVRDFINIVDGQEVRLSYLNVKYQYHRRLKKRTFLKDKDVRQVPITAEIRDDIDRYMTGHDRYLFSFHPQQLHPITDNRLREWLYKRLLAVGIPDREKRNITFHSTRRFFNTLLRHAQIADSTIQRFTGHASDDMTEHYTDYLPDDLQEINRAQSDFLRIE